MSLGGDKEVYILKCLKTLNLTQRDTPLAPLLSGLLSKICGFDQAPFTQDHLWESLSPIEIQGKAGPCESEHGPLSGVGPQNLQKGEEGTDKNATVCVAGDGQVSQPRSSCCTKQNTKS